MTVAVIVGEFIVIVTVARGKVMPEIVGLAVVTVAPAGGEVILVELIMAGVGLGVIPPIPGVGVGEGEGVGVGEGVARGVAEGVGEGDGVGIALGDGAGETDGFGEGEADGLGEGLAEGLGVAVLVIV